MFHFTAQRYCAVQLRLRGYFLLKRPLPRIYRHPELVICDVHTTTTVRGRRPNVFGALRYRHTHCRHYAGRASRRSQLESRGVRVLSIFKRHLEMLRKSPCLEAAAARCCCFLKLQASLRLCLRARYAISDTPSACTLSSSRQSRVGAIYVALPWVTSGRHWYSDVVSSNRLL